MLIYLLHNNQGRWLFRKDYIGAPICIFPTEMPSLFKPAGLGKVLYRLRLITLNEKQNLNLYLHIFFIIIQGL